MNHRYYKPYIYVMVATDGLVLFYSLAHLRLQHLEWPFLFLATITLTIFALIVRTSANRQNVSRTDKKSDDLSGSEAFRFATRNLTNRINPSLIFGLQRGDLSKFVAARGLLHEPRLIVFPLNHPTATKPVERNAQLK